jgi:hypothetical protein
MPTAEARNLWELTRPALDRDGDTDTTRKVHTFPLFVKAPGSGRLSDEEVDDEGETSGSTGVSLGFNAALLALAS